METVPIGTIVRLIYREQPTVFAVVVPMEWASNTYHHESFTRVLEHNYFHDAAVRDQGGWYIDGDVWPFEIVPEDQVPDEISALAMRCLLDPKFVPFV